MGKISYKKGTKIFKILGIPVCTTTRNSEYKKKVILNSIIRERKIVNGIETDSLSFYNKIFYRRTENEQYIEYGVPYVFSRKINKLKEFKKCLSNLVPLDYTKIFILNSNLGEAYYFLRFIINGLLTDDDKPLIITNNKSHFELIDIFVPYIPSLYVKKYKYDVSDSFFEIGSQKFYMVYNTDFYINAEKLIRTTTQTYPQIMQNVFGSLESNNYNDFKSTYNAEKEVEEYLKKNDIKEYVFLSEVAKTCEKIPAEFWSALEKSLGIAVIKNNTQMPLEMAYEFAKKSSAIITHRSGLSEFLSDIDTLQFAIYSDFKARYKLDELNSSRAICGYSLRNYPLVSRKIIEIEYNKQNETEIIKTIVNRINERDSEYENYCTSRG